MCGTSEVMMHICEREVIFVKGRKSQTVNVCSPAGRPGSYDWVFRFDSSLPLEESITPEEHATKSIEEFCLWLRDTFDGSVERVPPEEDVLLTVDRKTNPEETAGYVASTIALVNKVVKDLTESFIQNPYLHRSEHNLHCETYRRLMEEETFQRTHHISTSEQVELLQKEWPEEDWNERLGNFDLKKLWPSGELAIAPKQYVQRGTYDLSILAPQEVEACRSTKSYLDGKISPLIAIEFGLLEDYVHLRDNVAKLINNRVRFGYIVHFARPENKDNFEAVERLIDLVGSNTSLKVAYARVERIDGTLRSHKKLIGLG
jgi:hypothetical protein